MTMFIRNCWYVAAWPHELTEKPLARTLLGDPVVLYRQADGVAVALEDRCCHRDLPLSMGEICGDRIVCMYHGLAFDKTGKCVHIPVQDHIPENARVRGYPLVEQDGIVWIWMGDPALADPAGILAYPWHSDPEWAHRTGHICVAGRHELINDNLMDLSHVGWVHRQTIGGTPEAHSRATMKTEREGDSVIVRRWMPDSVPPPTYVRAVGFTGNIDRWMEIRYKPGVIWIYVGANDAGKGIDETTYRNTLGGRIFDGITPETGTTTHYFFSAAHNFHVDKPQVTTAFFNEILATFEEDRVVIEAQQARALPGRRQLGIMSDAGGVQVRRIVAERIAAESAVAGAKPMPQGEPA
jgi:vanillate O-demethylase monooxygenase subunit